MSEYVTQAAAVARTSSEHVGDELVDVLFTVAPGTSLHVRVSLLLEALGGGVKLEWPQEVVGFLEFWSTGDNFMNKILNTGDSDFTEFTFNDAVVGEWKSSSLDFTAASFIDEFADSLSGWITVGNEWLNHLDHVPCGLVEFDENGVVQLSQSEELQDFLWLWCKLSDTT